MLAPSEFSFLLGRGRRVGAPSLFLITFLISVFLIGDPREEALSEMLRTNGLMHMTGMKPLLLELVSPSPFPWFCLTSYHVSASTGQDFPLIPLIRGYQKRSVS